MKFLISLVIISGLLLGGCSTVHKEEKNDSLTNVQLVEDTTEDSSITQTFSLKDLNLIHVSTYHENSNKAQPELINVFHSDEDIRSFSQWIERIDLSEERNVSENIKNIYFFQLDYEIEGKVYERKNIAYIKSSLGKYYMKLFEMKPELNFDEFTNDKMNSVMEFLGRDGWYASEGLSLLNFVRSGQMITLNKDELNEVLVPYLSTSINEPTAYVNNIRYTDEDINKILTAANDFEIYNPYIPTEGIARDEVISVYEEQDSFVITFPHFTIRQSFENIVPNSEGYVEKKLSTKFGDFIWIYHNDLPQLLYTIKDDVYITITSAKPFIEGEFEKVLESLVQIKDTSRLESPIYLDETQFNNDQKEIVGLINKRMQYLFENKRSEYLKLLYSTGPINGHFPSYKIKKISLKSDINIQEQQYVYQAVVSVEQEGYDDEVNYNTYVFLKDKNNEDGWKLLDID